MADRLVDLVKQDQWIHSTIIVNCADTDARSGTAPLFFRAADIKRRSHIAALQCHRWTTCHPSDKLCEVRFPKSRSTKNEDRIEPERSTRRSIRPRIEPHSFDRLIKPRCLLMKRRKQLINIIDTHRS